MKAKSLEREVKDGIAEDKRLEVKAEIKRRLQGVNRVKRDVRHGWPLDPLAKDNT